MLRVLEQLYEKHWKHLMLVTIVFLLLSVAVIINNLLSFGSFMERDIDLSGGKQITFQVDAPDLEAVREAVPGASVRIVSGITKTLLIEVPFDQNETSVIESVKNAVAFEGEPSIRVVGPALGEIFFQQAQLAIAVAFILMAATVFLIFRSAVPSLIVILAAATDIMGTICLLSLLGVPLSLPVIGALLALIGYSVGPNILLTSELLKSGRSDYRRSIARAMKTGFTLTATALVALAAMLLLSGSQVIEQIAVVMLIGLVIDLAATWLTNAGFLRMWMERKTV